MQRSKAESEGQHTGTLAGVAFNPGRAQTECATNVMPRLVVTNARGKRRSVNLVPASNSQWPNETQMHQLDEINRILPTEILTEMGTRRLAVPAREIGLLLSRLKAGANSNITIEG